MRWLGAWLAAAAAVLSIVAVSGQGRAGRDGEPVLAHTVVRSYPHDSQAYTQGLIYRDGFLYESTGLNGRSSVRRVRLDTGEVVQQKPVDTRYFGEGMTDWAGSLIQLTWQTNVAFVYNRQTFALENTFTYPGEGWGLTHDGKRLIMSDGTAALRFLAPATYQELSRVTVTASGRRVDQLNELEFIKGEVWANVYQTDRIAIINPATGRVRAWLELTGLLPAGSLGHDVLNGIAYDAAGDRIFVTGKLWPRLFEIRVPPSRSALRRTGRQGGGGDVRLSPR